MAPDGGDANALLRSVVETLDLCTPCKNRILETDAPATAADSATDKGRILEKEDIAAAERASLIQGDTAAAARTTKQDSEIQNNHLALEEGSDTSDTESTATESVKTSTYV